MYYQITQDKNKVHMRYSIGLMDKEWEIEFIAPDVAEEYMKGHLYWTIQFNLEDLVNKHRRLAINDLSVREHYKALKPELLAVQGLKQQFDPDKYNDAYLIREIMKLSGMFHKLVPPASHPLAQEIQQQTNSLLTYLSNINL